MTTAERARLLKSLLAKLRSRFPEAEPVPPAPDEPTLREFVRSLLVWECPTSRAETAMRRIEQNIVDFNELRVCMPDDIVRMIGHTYPRAEDRAVRLRESLNGVFARNHSVSLEFLRVMPKRDARTYLEELPGVPRYAVGRTFLLALGGHAAPVDDRLLARLIDEKIAEAGADAEAASAWLERTLRAADAPEAHRLLQCWCDEERRTSSTSRAKPEAVSTRSPARNRSRPRSAPRAN
ncbi:MAG: hypothetical protein JNM07_08670 [Phycisphaerae bacterium]|nr:hypothetical protein [Phycisphaerae bacterium]